MVVFIVISREQSVISIHSTEKAAEIARKNQSNNEEAGGGRPSVWIKEMTVD